MLKYKKDNLHMNDLISINKYDIQEIHKHIKQLETKIDDLDSQVWNGVNEYDNPYYYPVLPKLNKIGLFSENKCLQGGVLQYDRTCENERIPFGTKSNWDEVDDKFNYMLEKSKGMTYLEIDQQYDPKVSELYGQWSYLSFKNWYELTHES